MLIFPCGRPLCLFSIFSTLSTWKIPHDSTQILLLQHSMREKLVERQSSYISSTILSTSVISTSSSPDGLWDGSLIYICTLAGSPAFAVQKVSLSKCELLLLLPCCYYYNSKNKVLKKKRVKYQEWYFRCLGWLILKLSAERIGRGKVWSHRDRGS